MAGRPSKKPVPPGPLDVRRPRGRPPGSKSKMGQSPASMANLKKGKVPKLWIDAANPEEPSTKATLQLLRTLAKYQATMEDAAASFEVSIPTFRKFLNENPLAMSTWECAKGQGRFSLRMMQMRQAETGNNTMLVWLGKQWLGQSDKAEVSGPGGGPQVVRIDLSQLSDEELDAAERIQRKLAESVNDSRREAKKGDPEGS